MRIGHTERFLPGFIQSWQANEGPTTFKVDQNTHLKCCTHLILPTLFGCAL